MQTTNRIVANALAARNAKPADGDEAVYAAFRKGLGRIAGQMLETLRTKFNAHIAQSENLLSAQSAEYKGWVDKVQNMEVTLAKLSAAR